MGSKCDYDDYNNNNFDYSWKTTFKIFCSMGVSNRIIFQMLYKAYIAKIMFLHIIL
jgi:hypothetical protein